MSNIMMMVFSSLIPNVVTTDAAFGLSGLALKPNPKTSDLDTFSMTALEGRAAAFNLRVERLLWADHVWRTASVQIDAAEARRMYMRSD